MIALFGGKLVWKLIGINVLVLGLLIVTLWMAIDYLAADYFTEIMKAYQISPATLHQMFLDAVHRYLFWVSALGIALAGALNFLLVRKVLGPLIQMAGMTESIAAGDFAGRVGVSSDDEVGDVARSFNRMSAGLERIDHLRRTLVTDVAHELRTPLTNIRGYLEAMRDGVIDSTPATFDSLHEETLRLANLAESLLDLARTEPAKTTLRPEILDFAEWIDGPLKLYRNRFEQKRIELTPSISAELAPVEADPDKLGQVVRNLLENAWRYTDEGGTLRIRAENVSAGVKVSFINSGPGIVKEDLPFVFERFYRGEKSRSRSHGGAGIGLAIVREIVEAHGGSVEAESADGVTRFSFQLPTHQDP